MAEAPQKGKSPLGMPFPFYQALPPGGYQNLLGRVRESQKVDHAGVVFVDGMSTYTAVLPYHWQQYPDAMNGFMRTELVEQGIKRKMEKSALINWSSGLPKLDPLVTTGDGNCLLHAAALYMWGIEDTDLILRSSLYETLNKGTFAEVHMKRWQSERAATDQAHLPDFRYNTREWDEEFAMVKSMAAPTPGQSPLDLPYPPLEEFHIYTLANILRRPVMVLAHDKVKSVSGASLQPLSVSGLYLPLHWDPAHCCKFPIVLGFDNCHFFPLMHTALEEARYEDLLVSLVQNTPAGTGFLKVHFTLPGEDSETVARGYLEVDTFIHCVSDKETAIGLPGAKLGPRSLDGALSVWEAYFNLAERNLRAYYEEEYNPGGAGAMAEPEATARTKVKGPPGRGSEPSHQHIAPIAAGLPTTAKPANRGQGQCKTKGCPYQTSMATGDVCVECFNKGERPKCRSADCLNKADVGLDGYCKVCHEGNKFQEQESSGSAVIAESSNSRGSSSGSSPTNDRFGEADVTSLAVNTFKSGFEKCIIPECQLTGNPNTADMCRDCYRQNMQVTRELDDAMQPAVANPDTEEFVVVDREGKETEPKVRGEMEERRAALMRKHGLDDKRVAPSDRTQSAAPAIAMGRSNHLAGRNAPPVDRAHSTGQPPIKITVKKDLCATAGCSGIRLKERELCRGCTDKKKQPAAHHSEPAEDLSVHHEQRMGRSGYREPHGKSASGPIPRPRQEPPRREESAYGMDHEPTGRQGVGYGQQHPGRAQGLPPEQYQELQRVGYSRERGISRGQESGYQSHGQPQWQHPGHVQEPVRRCKIKRCGQPAAPPDFKYCRDCLLDIEEDYITQKAAQMLQTGQYDMIRPTPSQQNIARDPAVRQKHPGLRSPGSAGGEEVRGQDMTHQLDQQLRAQFRHDRSDAHPAAPPRQPTTAERELCARSGGCPDRMFGSPETGGMCSKCWKEAGAKQPSRERLGSDERNAVNPMVREGHYQRPRGRDGGYQNYGERVTQPRDPVYEVIKEDRCAQPECPRPAADNVEKFCEQCHENYRALFSDYRQINTA